MSNLLKQTIRSQSIDFHIKTKKGTHSQNLHVGNSSKRYKKILQSKSVNHEILRDYIIHKQNHDQNGSESFHDLQSLNLCITQPHFRKAKHKSSNLNMNLKNKNKSKILTHPHEKSHIDSEFSHETNQSAHKITNCDHLEDYRRIKKLRTFSLTGKQKLNATTRAQNSFQNQKEGYFFNLPICKSYSRHKVKKTILKKNVQNIKSNQNQANNNLMRQLDHQSKLSPLKNKVISTKFRRCLNNAKPNHNISLTVQRIQGQKIKNFEIKNKKVSDNDQKVNISQNPIKQREYLYKFEDMIVPDLNIKDYKIDQHAKENLNVNEGSSEDEDYFYLKTIS